MDPLELSPEDFRRLAASVAELSAEYISTLDGRRTFPTTTGAETERLFALELPERAMGDRALAALADVIAHSRAQNGRFFGYVFSPGEPVAALGDLLASILNQNITAWRSAPAGVTIERTVVRWLAEAVGCGGFLGTLTGGGSAANLMGLTMAREAKTPANERGLRHAPAGVIYASEQVHMAVPKAIAMLGIGRENLRIVPCDASYRMIPAQLEQAIRRDQAEGIIPIAVVASAGTVNTGAIDPLREIAGIAHAHGAWMHVDGAYGALAAIAAPEKFDGLALADSLSLDPHKWLYQPLDCGCLLYRDADIARTTFAYTGDYAKQLSSDPVEGFAFFEESIELSRRCRALKLWLSLRYHGLAAFRAAIRKDLDCAQRLAAAVASSPALEMLAPVELSAVCFRHLLGKDASEEERNRFNLALLKRIVARGRVYLSNAMLGGRFCLRACIVNHLTKESDIDAIVPEVLAAGRESSVGA
ncbi:MAG: pyridoxal-dependent decarboxylase [Acidobacteriia bacterium]|nr:pyridoxal-dependent decarboxylase [Terriglobia bacterium]